MAPPVNPQAFQFRDRFYDLPVPPWLRTGNGEKYLYTLERVPRPTCARWPR